MCLLYKIHTQASATNNLELKSITNFFDSKRSTFQSFTQASVTNNSLRFQSGASAVIVMLESLGNIRTFPVFFFRAKRSIEKSTIKKKCRPLNSSLNEERYSAI